MLLFELHELVEQVLVLTHLVGRRGFGPCGQAEPHGLQRRLLPLEEHSERAATRLPFRVTEHADGAALPPFAHACSAPEVWRLKAAESVPQLIRAETSVDQARIQGCGACAASHRPVAEAPRRARPASNSQTEATFAKFGAD